MKLREDGLEVIDRDEGMCNGGTQLRKGTKEGEEKENGEGETEDCG